jgi:hypothetical protein
MLPSHIPKSHANHLTGELRLTERIIKFYYGDKQSLQAYYSEVGSSVSIVVVAGVSKVGASSLMN